MISGDLILVAWFDEDLIEAAPSGITVSLDTLFATDYLAPIGRDATIPMDFVRPLSTERSIHADDRVDLLRDGQMPAEHLANAARDARLDAAWIVPLMRDALMASDWIGQLTTPGGVLPVDFRAFLGRDFVVPESLMAAVSIGNAIPVEWSGIIIVSRDGAFPVDYRALVAAGRDVPTDFRSNPAREAVLSIDELIAVVRDALLHADERATVDKDGSIPIDWLGLTTIDRDGSLPVDFLSAIVREYSVHLSATSPAGRDAVTQEDWQRFLERLTDLHIDYRLTVTEQGLIQVEWSGQIIVIGIAGRLSSAKLTISKLGNARIDSSILAASFSPISALSRSALMVGGLESPELSTSELDQAILIS